MIDDVYIYLSRAFFFVPIQRQSEHENAQEEGKMNLVSTKTINGIF